MSVAIRSVKFWVNAFIPRVVPGYTRVVPGGLFAAKTMIPGPFRPGFEISDCYLTDQRGFSNDVHASSRLHSEFRVDFSGHLPTMTEWHHCDESVECDCEDGDIEGRAFGSTSRCHCTLLTPFSSVAAATGLVTVEMKCAANNPCAPSSIVGGDIDFDAYVHIAPAERNITVDCHIDSFPAFEAYATINDGAGVAMLQESPPPGNTVMNLPLSALRHLRRRLTDQDRDGVFETLEVL